MSKQLFELARMQIILAYKAGHLKGDEARVFAWHARIFPINHDAIAEAFADDFNTSQEQMAEVLKFIDEGRLQDKHVTFYKIEDHFEVRNGGMDRSEIIDICRMAFIDRRFDSKTWNRLVESGSGPVESQLIASPFEPSDIYL